MFGLSLLAELGANLDRSWFLVGPSWVHLRWSGVDRGPTWVCLGSSCGDAEYSWGLPGPSDAILKLSWAIPSLLGAICSQLGDLWGPSATHCFNCNPNLSNTKVLTTVLTPITSRSAREGSRAFSSTGPVKPSQSQTLQKKARRNARERLNPAIPRSAVSRRGLVKDLSVNR